VFPSKIQMQPVLPGLNGVIVSVADAPLPARMHGPCTGAGVGGTVGGSVGGGSVVGTDVVGSGGASVAVGVGIAVVGGGDGTIGGSVVGSVGAGVGGAGADGSLSVGVAVGAGVEGVVGAGVVSTEALVGAPPTRVDASAVPLNIIGSATPAPTPSSSSKTATAISMHRRRAHQWRGSASCFFVPSITGTSCCSSAPGLPRDTMLSREGACAWCCAASEAVLSQ